MRDNKVCIMGMGYVGLTLAAAISKQNFQVCGVEIDTKILSEIRELSRELDKNLEKKRELSRRVLGQLDEGMQRAEEACERFQNIIRDCGPDRVPIPDPLADSRRITSSVKALLERGLSREEIARHLGISVGEIELLIKLQPLKKVSGTREGK